MEFHSTFCAVKLRASSEVLLKGTVGADGLYKFEDCHYLASNLHLNKAETNMAYCNNASLFKPLSLAFVNVNYMYNKINLNFVATPISHSAYQLWHTRLEHPHHISLKAALRLSQSCASKSPY